MGATSKEGGELIPIMLDSVDTERVTIASSPSMQRLTSLARQVARTPSTVLLCGESGVGKEVIAQLIHEHSPRARAPFIAVNCAALSTSLLESELFGHEKGAFSGAVSRHLGIFERAHGGTILLDEVSEISTGIQAKLLRVLQERRMTRVGGEDEIQLDIRVIATTNRDLREAVDEGSFRLDLFYRLNVFPLRIPPLRDRTEDVTALVLYYLGRFARQFEAPTTHISAAAMSMLHEHPFPGNVRELVNACERAIILAHDSTVIETHHLLLEGRLDVDEEELPLTIEGESRQTARMVFVPGEEQLTDIRRRVILTTLEHFDGNRTRTAQALGVSIRTIRNKLRDYRERGDEIPEPE